MTELTEEQFQELWVIYADLICLVENADMVCEKAIEEAKAGAFKRVETALKEDD